MSRFRFLFLQGGIIFSGAYVDSCVPFAFLYGSLVALRNLFGNPPGYIFRCWIERKQFVEISVVQESMDSLFYMGKVADHTVGVKFPGLAVDGYYPVMAVELRTLAGI